VSSPADVRRELGLTIALCVVGAGAVLLAGELTWGRVTLVVGESLPVVVVELTGREAAPLAVALGLLGLAAAAALVATRGTLRRAVGFLVLLAGVAVIVDSVRASGRFAGLALDTSPGAVAEVTTSTGWSWLAVIGGAAMAGAGLVATVRGGRWQAMSARYEAPGSARVTTGRGSADALDTDAAWRALDRGDDPTITN
jgi:uncharacterized membrane protein (TIGR02234 family)